MAHPNLNQNHASLVYRPDIDGLRALAILLVLGFHAFPQYLPFGFIGVDIFFVISGYLICGIILKNIQAGYFSLAGFYARRVLRIFPGLALILSVCLLAGYVILYSNEFASLGKHIFGGAFFIDNILLWHESGYFDDTAYAKPLLNLWSLGIEEQYYIFFPFYVMLLAKKRVNLFYALFLPAALSFLDNIYLFKLYPPVAFYSPLSRVWELLVGALLNTLPESPPQTGQPERSRKLSQRADYLVFKMLTAAKQRANGLLSSAAGVVILAIAACIIRDGTSWPGWKALLPVTGAICIISAGPRNFINRAFFSNVFAVFTGKISYVLYLWHWPLLSFAYIVNGKLDEDTVWLRSILMIVAYILAVVTYFLIERPIRFNFRSKRATKIKIAGAVACVFSIGILGLWTYLAGGFPNREQFKNTQHIFEQLKLYEFKNEAAAKYLGKQVDDFLYALYDDAGMPETVAVTGDSHAGSAYHGIARLGRELGYNTLMLGQLLPGGELVKPEYGTQTKRILEFLAKSSDIRKIFIFTRGISYFTREDNPGERTPGRIPGRIPPDIYMKELQSMVNVLNAAGKQVYVVGENPELNIDIRDIFKRNLASVSMKNNYRETTLQETLARQKPYLEAVRNIKGATFIDSIPAFCSSGICRILSDDGIPLYFDDDHLSEAGSDFQARRILKQFLAPDRKQ